jgi:hypothetical protein
VTVWSIWKERNSIVFNRKEMSTKRLVYNIKINVWWWLKACKKGFCFDLNHWMLNPKACSGLATG